MVNVDYLRISVTNRCNLRCIYCHSLGGRDFIEHKEILRFEEIHRIVRLFVECGIKKVRLTGGEPLVRKNIVNFVRMLAGIEGIEDLSLTTNGVLLEPIAAQLKDAGLHRVNVSVDSAKREIYKQITGFDLIGKVRCSIYKAIEVGLMPVKINMVVLRGINEQDVTALGHLSMEMPIAVRFIEHCPTNKSTRPGRFFVPNSQVRRSIESRFGPLAATVVANSNGPAVYFKIKDSAGYVGFISGRTSIFCQSCNRLRLTSDGKVKPCLCSAHHYDIKRLIRTGASDKQVLDFFRKILAQKNNFTKLNSSAEEFNMQNIGG